MAGDCAAILSDEKRFVTCSQDWRGLHGASRTLRCVAHQLDQRLVVESKFRLGTAGPAEQIDFGDHDRPEFLIERVDLRPTRKAHSELRLVAACC